MSGVPEAFSFFSSFSAHASRSGTRSARTHDSDAPFIPSVSYKSWRLGLVALDEMLCMNVSSSESQALECLTVLGASTSQKRVHGVEDAMELDVATPSSPRGSKRKADTGGAPSAKRPKRAHDDGQSPPTSTVVVCKTVSQPEPVARPSASTSVATTSTRLLALELSRLRRQVRIPILKAHSPLQHEVLPHYHTFAHWQQSLSKRPARDPGSPESPLEDTEELFPIFERQDTPAPAEDGDEWDEFAREFERDLMQIGGDDDRLLSEPRPTRMVLSLDDGCDEELDYGEEDGDESSEDDAPLLSRTARPSWRTSDEQDGESDCESEEETPVTPPAQESSNHSRTSSSAPDVHAQPTTSFLRGEPQPEPESFFDASASEEEEDWDDCVPSSPAKSDTLFPSSPPPSPSHPRAPQSGSSHTHTLRTAKTFIAFTAPVRKFTMSLISARNLARMLQKDAGVPEPVCAVWRDRCAAAR